MRTRGLFSAFLVGLCACSKSPTQLLVVVDSDMNIPQTLVQVQASVRAENGRLLASSDFALVANRSDERSTNFALPLSFGVLPPDDDASSRVTVDVSALGTSTTGDAKALFSRKAITGFVEGKSLILPVYLAGQCQFLQCSDGQTCTEKGCVSEAIDETTLAESKGDSSDTVIRVPASDAGANMIADAGETKSDASMASDAGVNADATVAQEDTGTGDANLPVPDQNGLVWLYSGPAQLEFTRSEVTVEQFEQCVNSGACENVTFLDYRAPSHNDCNYGDANRGTHPMNCVNTVGANQFCEWAQARLPTESEWFAEASNNGERTYPWGDTPDRSCTHVVMHEDSAGGSGCGMNSSGPVCSKLLGNSVSGLCDMSGNVWEITTTAPGSSPSHVVRGGHWGNRGPDNLQTTGRGDWLGPDAKLNCCGFRCARIRPSELGSSERTATLSCLSIKTARPNAPDGTYWIDPDGPGGTAAFEAYCDMTTDGGGWTLVITASLVDNAVQLVNNRSDIIAGTYLTGTQGSLSDDFDLVSPALYQVSGQELMAKEGNHIGYWKTDSGCLENQPLGAWFAMDFVAGSYRKACDKILGSGLNDMWSTYDLRNNWGGHSDKIVIMNNERDERDNYSFIGHRLALTTHLHLNLGLSGGSGDEEGDQGLIVTADDWRQSTAMDMGFCDEGQPFSCGSPGDNNNEQELGRIPPAIHYFVR